MTESPVLAPVGLLGEVAIADNFDVAAGIERTAYPAPGGGGIPGPSLDPPGAFRMHCTSGQLLYEDPIVYPGGKSPHLHQFFGNTGANAGSTYGSLRTSGGTTCGDTNSPANRSAYWLPAMLDGAGGVVRPKHIQIYYKRHPANSPKCAQNNTDGKPIGICTDLPNGLRYVIGFSMASHTGGPADSNSEDQWHMFYECWGSGAVAGRFKTLKDAVAAGCPVGADLMIMITAPNCWDGKNLDTPNHRSHVAYGDKPWVDFWRGCPDTHPYVIPDLQLQIAYAVDSNFRTWALSSDVQMGMTPGSTLHFDYWEAWSPTVKATWHQTCINKHLTCSGGDLGNGTQIKNASPPWPNGWPIPAIVPVPAAQEQPAAPSPAPAPDSQVIQEPAPVISYKTCPNGKTVLQTQNCPPAKGKK